MEKSHLQGKAGGNKMQFRLYRTINQLLDSSSFEICRAEGQDAADKGRLKGLRLVLPEGEDDS